MCLTTLSVTHNVWCRSIGWFVNNKLSHYEEEKVCGLIEEDSLSHCLPNSLDKTTKNDYQDGRNPGLYSNWGQSECKSVDVPLKRTPYAPLRVESVEYNHPY
jgi:hypothetical protein